MKKDQKVAERGHEQATVTPNFASEPMLFEIAYEVCQQLGGIYTVIRSKVPSMIQKWGNRYCLIGPFNPDVSPAEYEEGIPTPLQISIRSNISTGSRMILPCQPMTGCLTR